MQLGDHHPHLLPFLLCCLLAIDSSHSSQPPFACDESDPRTPTYGFCKQSLPISEKVRDLVSRLSVEEKISQLGHDAAPIPRLGIPGYMWWSEALHGISGAGGGLRFGGSIPSATSFPQVIHTAAAFNSRLWYRIGEAIGTEARAFYNNGQTQGLTFWAPNINIFRDPRWGRGQETPGEDPLMTGTYATSFVRGFQGDPFEGVQSPEGPYFLKASACCKHFTAYDLDNWENITRYMYDAKVTLQDLSDTYQPPFRSCIEKGRASGVMCAYNSVNGVPACADPNLLSKTAREEWGFNGYVVSDCDAVSIIYSVHHYANTPEDAAAKVLTAGMDVNCGVFLQKHTNAALEQKKISESDIDRALHNLFSVRMRLGLFNGDPKGLPYGDIGPNQVCSQDHLNLALEAAREGIVLLKNSAKLLPLSKTRVGSLAVIGPNADNATTLLGDYHGTPCKQVSPLHALQNYVKDTRYDPGCKNVACSVASIDNAVEVARDADYVILIMGLDQTQEREELDRTDLVLPGQQRSLISSVARAAKNPLLLVVLCGGPIDIAFAKHDPKIGSILWAGYPGEAGGLALADVIFGVHNPGGRLPVTWYPREYTKTSMTDMRMRPDPRSGYPGRTYRFYRGRQVFKFGYGLSYSAYSYEFVSATRKHLVLKQSSSIEATKDSHTNSSIYDTTVLGADFCESLKFSAIVRVENQGEMAGTHPVLLFVQRSEKRSGAAIKELLGFDSVRLEPGERSDLEFHLNPCDHLSRTVEDGSKVMEAGDHFLVVGDARYKITVLG